MSVRAMRCVALMTAAWLAVTALSVAGQETEVFVLGALGALHDREESFDFETLERVIRAIGPQVLLLEVTPEELRDRLDTRGRPEYPNVVWPMLGEARGPESYAMEAGEPLYGELTSEGSELWTAFQNERPTESAAFAAYAEAATDVLLARWKSPADTQDEATDALARSQRRLRAALVPAVGWIQVRWDRVMLDVATKAIAQNPGKRVLVLGSHHNSGMFVEALGELPGVRLVDMRSWLVGNGFGGPL